jgi:hypothetical protein
MRDAQGVLERLGRLNRTGVFLGTVVLVLAGLLLPGAAGAVLLLALAVALIALLRLTWPHHDQRTRVLRTAVLAILVVAAVAKLVA